jgi:hypothetical protein
MPLIEQIRVTVLLSGEFPCVYPEDGQQSVGFIGPSPRTLGKTAALSENIACCRNLVEKSLVEDISRRMMYR